MAGKTDFSRVNADITAAAEKEASRKTKTFEKVDWLKVTYGDTTFSILPPFVEGAHVYAEVYIHHNFLDNNNRKRSYRCSKQLHEICPICDRVAALTAAGNTQQASQMEGKKTFLYNVLDIDLKNRVAGFKPSQHNEVLQELQIFHADELIDLTDLANGRQLKLTRTKTKPYARVRTKSEKVALQLTPEQIEAALKGLKDLSKIYVNNTPAQLTEMLAGKEVNPGVAASRAEESNGTNNTVSTETAAPTPVAAAPAAVAATTETVEAAPAKRGRPAAAAPSGEVKTAAAPAPAQQAAAPAPAAAAPESTGDDELDAIMNLMDS